MLRTSLLTILTMIAFAGNSVLCRVALKETTIDATSFTSIRLASGALILWAIAGIFYSDREGQGNWWSGLALFVYAAGFSFAYISLPAATGALLLFGAVQATMIAYGLWQGERLHPSQWLGLLLAIGGLVFLMSPGLSAPPVHGSILMLGAGIAWGVYSLRGRSSGQATRISAGNFLRSLVFIIPLALLFHDNIQLDSVGVWYAIGSGAVTSGMGYALWYTVLPFLKASTAATVQLSVPVIAALGGILFVSEPITLRFTLASITILGGIALVIFKKAR